MVDAVTGDAARSEAAGIDLTTVRPEAPSNSINSRLPRTRRIAFFFSMAHGAHQAAVLTIQVEPTVVRSKNGPQIGRSFATSAVTRGSSTDRCGVGAPEEVRCVEHGAARGLRPLSACARPGFAGRPPPPVVR